MSLLFRFSVLLFICAFSLTASGQQDSADRKIKTRWITLDQFQTNPTQWENVDTNIDFIHQYNPVYQIDNFYQYLGNLGTPVFDLQFNPFTNSEFRTGLEHYDLYLYKPQSLPFMDTYTPFTHLEYSQAFSGELQDLRGVHSRNITPFWNVGIRFNRMNSVGSYLSQETKRTNIGLNTRYETQSGRYKVFLSGIWNQLNNQKNGGIQDVDQFLNLKGGEDRTRLSVNLEDARERYSQKSFNLNHFYFLGPKQVDTILKQRDTFITKDVHEKLYIQHEFGYSQESYAYIDDNPLNDDGFYPAIFQDSSRTYDSMFHSSFTNEVAISNFGEHDTLRSSGLGFRVAGEWTINQYSQEEAINEVFQNIMLSGEIKLPVKKHELRAEGNFFPIGRYQGNYQFHESLVFQFDSLEQFTVGHRIQHRSPDFLKTRMISNHLQWDKNLNNPVFNRVYLDYNHEGMGLNTRLNYSLLYNYIYYDENIEPAQVEAPISNFSAEANYRLQVGPVHMATHFLFQYFSNNEAIRLPDWAVRSSLYYQNSLFNDNLRLSTGLDFRYNKPYMANAFFPSYNIFYQQNRREIGGYPVFDIFVNFRIQRFRGFLKLSHVNKGFTGNDYFLLPEYPLYPRTFSVGVKWLFFD